VRAGHSTITLAAKTELTLIPIGGGVHVDMDAGSLYFSAAENELVEVHAQEALLRPEAAQPTQARITILAPKVVQISAVHGGLNFSYREEFRNLPEGQTHRTYLDAGDEPQVANGSAGLKGRDGWQGSVFHGGRRCGNRRRACGEGSCRLGVRKPAGESLPALELELM
jgi:hypothetical protein